MISVLVVDDDDETLKATGEILRHAGIAAEIAPTGLQALALIRRTPIDLVVVDLRLRDIGGVELLRSIREERPGIAVIVTGVATPGTAIEAGRLGAVAYLDKPIHPDTLVDAVLAHVPIVSNLRWADAPQSSWTHPQGLHAVRIIDDRYWETELNVRSLARELGMSTEHLCRVLKRQTGDTFVTLLRETRVRAACRLLVSTTLCMKEIAARVGFSSASRFARDFKKLRGVSASEYRAGILRVDALSSDTVTGEIVSES
jgi:YesN/AraC family two-component response regulator